MKQLFDEYGEAIMGAIAGILGLVIFLGVCIGESSPLGMQVQKFISWYM